MIWSLLLLIVFGCGANSDEAKVPAVSGSQNRVASATQLVGPWNNRLEKAQSPYLRMHGQDPVDWYAWGDEAFAAAKRRNVPIFLSIGYYACHWCHVMHRESFKDPAIAAFLNQHFVAIKVDREERPDVDSLYMDAVHILNRNNGGWPASIWLTPDGKPFFAGTYFPPESRMGRPGFMDLLNRIQTDWKTKPGEMHQFAEKTGKRMLKRAELQGGGAVPAGTAADASRRLLGSWSSENRGWGTRRQFPTTPTLQFLLWHSVVEKNEAAGSLVGGQLAAMDEGGIHDHLGGGFHRYTVDPQWVVPHFEKMLYDNAQLLATYAEAAVVLDRPRFSQVAEDIADYLIDQMQDENGGFYSAQSADSEGEEGAFYVWKPAEVSQVLGDAQPFLAAYPVTEKGNFDGNRTVLNRQSGIDPEADTLKMARQKLFEHRAKREPPPTDKKLVVAWNGLAIGGLARAGRLLNKPRLITAAQRAAQRALSVVEQGKVPRLIAAESPLGVLEDYAFLGNGLLDLFEADGNPLWLTSADAIAATMVQRFRDPETGVLHRTDKDVVLLARKAELTDEAEPSGFGRGLRLLARLRAYGSPTVSTSVIDSALQQSAWLLERAPNNAVSIVNVAERVARRSTEVVIATPSMDDPNLKGLLDAYNEEVRPYTVLATVTPESAKKLTSFSAILGKEPGEGSARAFLCFEGVCHLPTSDVGEFKKQLLQKPGG